MVNIRPSKKAFLITLIVLMAILIVYGVLRWVHGGPILPDPIDKHLPDGLIVAAIVIMLWNRQIIKEEKLEAEAKKKREELEAAEKAEASAETNAGEGSDDEGGIAGK